MNSLEVVLKRDRWIVACCLIVLAGLSWAYLVYMARVMSAMPSMSGGAGSAMDMAAMAHSQPWTAADFIMTALMWAVMMVAMMVPAAAPMVLLFATFNRQRKAQERPFVSTGVFLTGYFVVWWGFAILATAAQWGLHQAAMLSSMMGKVAPLVGGGILIAAGAFQWTPLKEVCLKHCRSPLDHLRSHWRDGRLGALMMGVEHGAFCLGCCWFLMALMFVVGVMNLAWMAGLTVFILLEKIIPQRQWGRLVGWSSGAALVVMGAWMAFAALGA